MPRPAGVKETRPRNTVARKLAAQAAQSGLTPLDLMLMAMREDWTTAETMREDGAPEDHDLALEWATRINNLRASAISTADKVAPYLHPRLASTDTTIKSDNIHRVVSEAPLTLEEWTAKHAASAAAVIVERDDPV